MTRREKLVLAAAVGFIVLAWLLARVDQAGGHVTLSYSPVPPSAITPVRAPQGLEASDPATPRPARTPVPVDVSERPRATGPVHPSPRPSLAMLVRVGVASNMGPAFPASYLALPQGPGWLARVCGQGGCITRVSTDTGPEAWTGRVADLSVHDFEAVSGQAWTRGLTTVTVTLLGRSR